MKDNSTEEEKEGIDDQIFKVKLAGENSDF